LDSEAHAWPKTSLALVRKGNGSRGNCAWHRNERSRWNGLVFEKPTRSLRSETRLTQPTVEGASANADPGDNDGKRPEQNPGICPRRSEKPGKNRRYRGTT
jgi:hypothetical protein